MNYNIIPDLPFKFTIGSGLRGTFTATSTYIDEDGWVQYDVTNNCTDFTHSVSVISMLRYITSGHWKIIKEENTMKKIKTTDLKGFIAAKHQPYTDYNQEIADWLMENADRVDFNKYARDGSYIFTSRNGEFYVHKTITGYDQYYTNEEFKEWIGMTKKATSHLKELISEYKEVTKFTKADLKDGMVCATRGEKVYMVQGDRMIREGGMYMLLEDINDDLTVEDLPEFDIVHVQQTITVFERVDEKKLAIQKELEFAKAKAERLAAHISVLETKLKR